MAMLLNRQKPIARSGVAWWPGGRMSAKGTRPSLPEPVAAMRAARRRAARPRSCAARRGCRGRASAAALRAARLIDRRCAARVHEQDVVLAWPAQA